MKALVIGATGATGVDLVHILLKDSDYREVVLFVRRPSGITHPKLSEHLVDFDNIHEVSALINGDVWFSCLGTTGKAAGSDARQWHIDYEIPVQFAHIARRNGVSSAVLLSSYGASAKSKSFYLKTKGQLEEQIATLKFDQYIIFRPGILLRKDTDRLVERVTSGLLQVVNRIGILRKYRPMPTAILAAKMAKSPKILGKGMYAIELDEILKF